MKKFAAALLVAPVFWTACTLAGPAAPSFEMGKNLSLRVGESAQARSGDLRVGFVGVSSDSRCPKGVQCVWAGDATVQVWLQQGSGPREVRELHTAAGRAQSATALGHVVQLVSLEPYPVANQAIKPSDYVATITLTPGRAAPADAAER
jgi:hypothetical protein